MSKLVRYSSALILASLSSLVLAKGGVNGGGGRAVVCRDGAGKIKTAELLDLWEARVIDKLTLRKALPTYRANLVDALTRYNNVLGYSFGTDPATSLESQLKEIESATTFLPDSVRLESVDDSKEPAVPVGCKVEQLAHLYEDRRLLIQESIWNRLNPQNKAALIIHEMMYYERREQGDSNSRTARRWVGAFFSTKGLKEIGSVLKEFEGQPNRPGLHCTTQFRPDMLEYMGHMIDFWIDTAEMPTDVTPKMVPVYFRSIPGQNALETYTTAKISSQVVDALAGKFDISTRPYLATIRAEGELDRVYPLHFEVKTVDGKIGAYVHTKDRDGKPVVTPTFCAQMTWNAELKYPVYKSYTPATSNIHE